MTVPLLIHLVTLSLFMGLLLSAAIGDLKRYRIPNSYSISLVALYPLFVLSAPYAVSPLVSLSIMAAVLVLSIVAFALRWIGGGDAKLLAAAALFAGPAMIIEFLVVTALAGGMLSVVMLSRSLRVSLASTLDHVGNHTLRDAMRADVIPYGVAIAAGGVFLALRLVAAAANPA